MAFLKEKGVDFKVTEHKAVMTSEEAAEVRGVSLASGAKAILLKDTGKKLALEGVPFYLAVQSASNKFASKTFKKLINSKGIRFATPEEYSTLQDAYLEPSHPLVKYLECQSGSTEV